MSRLRLADEEGRLIATLEVAESLLAAARGLSFRTTLAADEGMWFPGVRSIHMLGMRLPIDVLFLSHEQDGLRIVRHIARDVRPWTGLAADHGADGCIELAAGAAAGIAVGDRVTLRP